MTMTLMSITIVLLMGIGIVCGINGFDLAGVIFAALSLLVFVAVIVYDVNMPKVTTNLGTGKVIGNDIRTSQSIVLVGDTIYHCHPIITPSTQVTCYKRTTALGNESFHCFPD